MLCYLNIKFLLKPSGFLKILQVVTSLVCISLLRHYLLSFGSRIQDGSFHDRDLMGKATLAGMIVVTAPTLIANLFSEGHSLLTELLHCFIGMVLFLVSGVFVLTTYRDPFAEEEVRKAGIALGSLCVVNALFYALDTFFTFSRWRLQ